MKKNIIEKYQTNNCPPGSEYYFFKNGIPPEEAEAASKAWGEGHKGLTKLLKNCIKRGIRTFACCSGHEEEQDSEPYIAFYVTDEEILDLAVLISEEKNYKSMMFWLSPWGLPAVAIYSDMDRREDFFKNMNEYVINENRKSLMKNEVRHKIFSEIVAKTRAGNRIFYYAKENCYSIPREEKRHILEEDILEELSKLPSQLPEARARHMESFLEQEELDSQEYARKLAKVKKGKDSKKRKKIEQMVGNVGLSSILEAGSKIKSLREEKKRKKKQKKADISREET